MPETGYADLMIAASGVAAVSDLLIDAEIAHPTDADPDALDFDVSIDGSVGDMATVPSIAAQELFATVRVGGVTISPGVLRAISVSRRLEDTLQSWSIELTLDTPEGPLGSPWLHRGGPSTCLNEVDIFGGYKTATGFHSIPLIQGGIGHVERRTSGNGFVTVITGVDFGGRSDRKLIELALPPGHGLPRRRVIEIAARRAGVEDISLEVPSQASIEAGMMKEFQLVDGNYQPPCQDLADTDLRRLLWDRNGTLVWRRVGVPQNDEQDRWTFNEASWVAGTVNVTHPGGDVVTRVVANGVEQLPVGVCGDITVTTELRISGLTGPASLAFNQQSDGTYDPVAPRTAWDVVKLMRLELLEKTTRCGILVKTRRRAYQYNFVEAVRYQWLGGLDIDPNAAADGWSHVPFSYTNDDASGDSPAFTYPYERWMMTEVDEDWHFWQRDGFAALWSPGFDGNTAGLLMAEGSTGFDDPKYAGVKLGTISNSWRWITPQAKVRDRPSWPPPLIPWEEVDPDALTYAYGDRRGFSANPLDSGNMDRRPLLSWYGVDSGEGAVFGPSSATVTVLESDGRGHQTKAKKLSYGWFARPGMFYQYGDGFDRAEDKESFRYVGSETETFVANGEQNHDYLKISTDMDGNLSHSEQHLGLEGYLPPIDRIPEAPPLNTGEDEEDADVYGDEAEIEALAQRALLTDGRPFSVDVIDEGLEQCHAVNEVRLHCPYAENEEEAERMAWHVIDESAAVTVDGELARINFLVEPGDVAYFKKRPLGLPTNLRGRVYASNWNWTAESGWTQTIEGKVYDAG